MILRAITLSAGLAGAAGLSQFPEFSQQYVQRLGGAVDEVSRTVADFDRDAHAAGLSRAQALVELAQGGAFGRARATSMADTMARAERLSADLAVLRQAPALQRALRVYRLTDREIAAGTYAAFRPAMPLTVEGGLFAGIGFVAGAFAVGGLMSLVRLFLRRRWLPERQG